MRTFAPFNAMLLHVQKPGLTYAASAADWRIRFGRTVKRAARPLLIMWPFGPVALVYDILDTVGPPLPPGVESFAAEGDFNESDIGRMLRHMDLRNLEVEFFDGGDGSAGWIELRKPQTKKEPALQRIYLNRNHSPNTKFATLTHELAHLYLGHLGPDREKGVKDRRGLGPDVVELEAESVAYVVCQRQGVECSSHSYLANYVDSHTTVDHLDLYRIMRACGAVEAAMGLNLERSTTWLQED